MLATAVVAAVLCASPPSVVGAGPQDWTQWRGPGRDGVAPGVSLPETWPDELQRTWQVEVGAGYSSPIVSDGRVYVFSRQGEEEVLQALNLEDGSVLWRFAYDAPYDLNFAARSHGKGPKSTPILVDGMICSFGISGALSCLDAVSGEPVWQIFSARQFAAATPVYGVAMSPAVVDGQLVVHLGGGRGGALTAVDPASGEVVWQWTGDGPGYASPILTEIAGRPQLVTQSQKNIIGVSPADGELLWQIPFETPHDQNIVTPLVIGENLIFSGLEQRTFAVGLTQDGDRWAVEEGWSNEGLTMYMSSPVLVGERLFGFSNTRRGQFFCLDPESGETIWTSEGRQGDNAALVVADGRVLALTSNAELFVLDPEAPEFLPVARYELADSATYAHPVPTARGILVKDDSHLTLWSW